MPADTNANGDMFGGWLLSQMDLAGSIVAVQKAKTKVATVGVRGDRRSVPVSDHVYGMSEIVGSSTTSVDDAIRTAVRKAAQTVRNIEWFQAEEIRGQVVDGDVAYYQVTLKVGFRVD